MKRLYSFLLIIVIACSLLASGCGKNDTTDTSSRVNSSDYVNKTVADSNTKKEAKAKDKKNSIDLSSIPAYSGSPYIEINGNEPYFSEEDKRRTDAFETYSNLDSLGRCGVAYANVCKEIMPTEERGKIGQIRWMAHS